MNNLSAIKAAIKAKLESVEGIGIVHDYVRYDQANQKKFKEMYVTNGTLLGWTIHRTQSVEREFDTSSTIRTHRFDIRGYLQLEDDEVSENVMDDLVERICAAFRVDEDLGCVVNTTSVNGLNGIQVEESDWVMFVGVLCHGVRLTLAVEVTEDASAPEPEALDAVWIGIDMAGNEQNPDITSHTVLEVVA